MTITIFFSCVSIPLIQGHVLSLFYRRGFQNGNTFVTLEFEDANGIGHNVPVSQGSFAIPTSDDQLLRVAPTDDQAQRHPPDQRDNAGHYCPSYDPGAQVQEIRQIVREQQRDVAPRASGKIYDIIPEIGTKEGEKKKEKRKKKKKEKGMGDLTLNKDFNVFNKFDVLPEIKPQAAASYVLPTPPVGPAKRNTRVRKQTKATGDNNKTTGIGRIMSFFSGKK